MTRHYQRKNRKMRDPTRMARVEIQNELSYWRHEIAELDRELSDRVREKRKIEKRIDKLNEWRSLILGNVTLLQRLLKGDRDEEG